MHKIASITALSLLISMTINAQPANTPAANIPTASAPLAPLSSYSGGGLADLGTTTLRNFVRTYILQTPIQNTAFIANTGSYPQAIVNTAYIDGLGRPLQEVLRSGTELSRDLVKLHIYDNKGRETYQYLPFSTSLPSETGKLKEHALTTLSAQYSSLYPGEYPYSKNVYDNSPLDRIKSTLSPGMSWIGSNLGTQYIYESNTTADNFLKWTIGSLSTDLPVSNGYYNPAELVIITKKDEDGNIIKEVKDKLGRLICKRSSLVALPNSVYQAAEWAQTYYVYDDINHVRFVLSPEAVSAVGNGSVTTAIANGLCYRYLYDERGRIVEKQIPGKTVEYLIYDTRDRIVLSQDGNLRSANKWYTTVYDGQNRPIATGIYSPGTTFTRLALSQTVNDPLTPYTSYTSSQLFYYLKNFSVVRNPLASQQITDVELITKSYYDDYNYTPLSSWQFTTSLNSYLLSSPNDGIYIPASPSANTNGLLTGNEVRIENADGTWGTWLGSVNYYDDKGHLVQQQKNTVKGTDIMLTQYDFPGNVFISVLQHNFTNPLIPALQSTIIVKAYLYDYKNGHLQQVRQKINNGVWMSLTCHNYDELGRICKKRLAMGMGAGFEQLYTYNIRNWITGINPGYVDGTVQPGIFGPFFGEKLSYDRGFASRLYNGNIAGIEWKGGIAGARKQFYGYSYDPLNRLMHAEYGIWDPASSTYVQNNPNDINYTVSNISYYDNGNLKTMTQNGPLDNQNGPPGTPAIIYGNMDVLDYHYKPTSNQLDHVDDNMTGANLSSTPDFRDLHQGAGDYDYDDNGNLTKDQNKNIAQPVLYSHLNKPLAVNLNGNMVQYIYDAQGEKLEKIVTPAGGTAETWYYTDGFVWKNNELQYVLNEEGRARPRSNGTDFDYDFFIKDHLDNVRTVVSTETIPYYPDFDNGQGVPVGPPIAGGMAPPPVDPKDYTTGLEIASANAEGLVWNHLDDVRDPKPGSTDPQDTRAARLSAADSGRTIGTALMLRTMTGDNFTLDATSYYETGDDGQNLLSGDVLANALLTTLSGGTVNTTIPVADLPENMQILQRAFGNGNFASMLEQLQTQNTDPERPPSFLNYIVFDENMQVMADQSGAIQISGENAWTPTGGPMAITIKQAGYISVFTSTRSPRSVYWDQIRLVQYKGTVLEENHYYPFGLTLNTAYPGTASANKHMLTTKELQGDYGLNWYNFGARMMDEQTGRWIQNDPLSEKMQGLSPYNYCFNNPIKTVDPTGLEPEPDIVFKGDDDKELRIIAPGKDVVVDVPVALKENRTVDLGLGSIDPNKFVYGYTVQADVGLAFGGGGQWGGQVSVARYTDPKYAGYNYVYAGVQAAGSIGVQMNFSASVGGSVFVGYNTGNDYSPSSFAGPFYAATWNQDLKEVVGGGYNVNAFSSTPDIGGPGWKGLSVGVSVGAGESVNIGAIGIQTSNTMLLNDVMPTSQRSWADRLSNGMAPIPSAVTSYLYRQANL